MAIDYCIIASSVLEGHKPYKRFYKNFLNRIQFVFSKYKLMPLPSPAIIGSVDAIFRSFPSLVEGGHDKNPRIVHCIGTLSSGGAERQLINFLKSVPNHGRPKQSLLLINPLEGSNAHFLPLIEEHMDEIRVMGDLEESAICDVFIQNRERVKLILGLHPLIRNWVLGLWVEFKLMKPTLVHCWLDHPNIWGGIAALLADVPCVLLSTRNVNPTHFPYLYQDYMHVWYKKLANSQRVAFLNNSRPGANDYANWLGISEANIPVVLNGLDFNTVGQPSDDEIKRFDNEQNLDEKMLLIVGAFRFSEEKQPLMFIEVAAKVLKARPDAVVLLLGEGPMEKSIRKCVEQAGLRERIRLLGRRNDVQTIFSRADLLLHTAKNEGTPNVLLEAQHLGTPVVSTKAGGAIHAVLDGETGYLLEVDDLEGIVDRVLVLLDDREKRMSFSKACPVFVEQRFGLNRMVSETLAVQDKILGHH